MHPPVRFVPVSNGNDQNGCEAASETVGTMARAKAKQLDISSTKVK